MVSCFGSTQMKFRIGCVLFVVLCLCSGANSQCGSGQSCDALGSYYLWEGTNLTFTGTLMNTSDAIIANVNKLPNKDSVQAGTRVNVPFSCGCINGSFLGHVFEYDVVKGDTYEKVASLYYANLTTADAMAWFNEYPDIDIPDNAKLNVVVNCSCGNSAVSEDYGLFITYPLRPGDSLASIAQTENLDQRLLQDYNPGVNFSGGSGYVYIPGKGLSFLSFKILMPAFEVSNESADLVK